MINGCYYLLLLSCCRLRVKIQSLFWVDICLVVTIFHQSGSSDHLGHVGNLHWGAKSEGCCSTTDNIDMGKKARTQCTTKEEGMQTTRTNSWLSLPRPRLAQLNKLRNSVTDKVNQNSSLKFRKAIDAAESKMGSCSQEGTHHCADTKKRSLLAWQGKRKNEK